MSTSDGSIVTQIELGADAKDNHVTALAWNRDCSLLRGCTHSGLVFQVDPRTGVTGTVDPDAMHLGVIPNLFPTGIVHLTHLSADDDEIVMICGQTPFKEPYYVIYDLTDLSAVDWVNPPWKTTYDNKGCLSLLTYDRSTSLVYIGMKGASDVRVMLCTAPDCCELVALYKSPSIVESFALMPKHAIRKREVNRLVQLTRDRSQLVMHVRKGKLVYETLAETALVASIGVKEYMGGANVQTALQAVMVEASYVEEKTRKVSKFLHTSGSARGSSSEVYLNCKVGATTLISISTHNLKVNSMYMCFPAKATAGGALAVVEHGTFGKVVQKEIRAHAENISAYDLSVLNGGRLIATGAGDCQVLLWRLPATVEEFRALAGDADKSGPFVCVGRIVCSGKVTYLGFSRLVDSTLVVCERGLTESTLRIFDIAACVEAEECVTLSEEHCVLAVGGFCKDGISDVAFDGDGQRMAVTALDNRVRVYALNGGADDASLLCEFAPREMMRDIQVRFVNAGDTHLLTAGFGEASIRRLSLYDLDKLIESGGASAADDEKKEEEEKESEVGFVSEVKYPVDNAVPIIYYDADNSLLYVSFVGDRRIRVVEVRPAGLSECLGHMLAKEDIIGFAVFPKRFVDVRRGEVARMIRLGRDKAWPVSFVVPRKRLEYFQDDIYPDTVDIEKPLYADVSAYLSGSRVERPVIAMKPEDMTALSEAPPEEMTVHMSRRASFEAKSAAKKLDEAPKSTEEAMESFGRMAADAPGANRWDAKCVGTEVDEDEWSD